MRAVWRDAAGARRRSCHELDGMDRRELEHIAADLGMTGTELRALAARGPHAADELAERMRIMGLTRADADDVSPGLAQDLERTCAHCREKRRCRRDLARRPDDAAWAGYCPNAIALTAIGNARQR
jgi:uncharacterized protein YjiS (DUF1127 family)